MKGVSKLRPAIASLLLTSGLIGVLFGILLTYASHVFFDPRSFAERAARSVRDPAVAVVLADRISQAAVSANRDLTPFRPLIFYAAREVVASQTFSSLVRTSARTLHSVAFSGNGEDLLLSLRDGGILLRSALPVLPPQLLAQIPDRLVVRLVDGAAPSLGIDRALALLRDASALARAVRWMLASGVVLVLLAAWVSPTPWRSGREAGWLLIFTAAMLVLVDPIGALVIDATGTNHGVTAAAIGVWRSFVADAAAWALVIGGVGVILVSPSLDLERHLRVAWGRLTRVPERSSAQLLRAVALIVAGYALFRWPRAILEGAVSVVGVGVLAVGVSALGKLLFHSRREERVARAAVRPAVIVLGTALAAAVAIGSTLVTSPTGPSSFNTDACNGKRALCSRPLDRVVFAGTHNSMASGDQPTWFFPAQEVNVRAQLQDGIRGFQIDAHYGQQVGTHVLTVLHDEGNARRAYEGVIGKEGVDAAFRIRDRLLGLPRGERRIYLCHGFCEIGAIELADVFRTMREFLDEHPREVLMIVIQDEDVDPADIARVAEQTGLADRVYRGPVTGPWPTLGEMIEQQQQVLIVAENDAGDVPWFHPAFEVFQETPYDVRAVADFSCKPWRGGTHGTLFQFNHWITRVPAPRPSDAALVNSYDFLMQRVRACELVRNMIPNLLAVDHYRTGDLFEVVDELNRSTP